MSKSIKKSPGQIYAEQILARRQAAKGGTGFNGSVAMDPAEKAEIERVIGRPLTGREQLQGRLDRPDTRPVRERLAGAFGGTPQRDQLAEEIAKAEKRVADALYRKMSPEEKELFRLKQDAADLHAKEVNAAEQSKRLAEAKDQLARLDALEARWAFDPMATYADMAALDEARAALESTAVPFADAVKAVDAVYATDTGKKQAIVDALKQSRAATEVKFQEQIAAIEAELGTVAPKVDAAPVEKKEPTAWDHAKAALVQATKAETREAKNAAMAEFMRWNAVDQAEQAAANKADDDSAAA